MSVDMASSRAKNQCQTEEALNSSGLRQYHLRRIGPPATKQGVADVMDLSKVTSLIGRNRNQVDFLLDSSNPVTSQYISRLHARIVRQSENFHRLYDDSLNGIFINNAKIQGSVVLQEGDIITFGHPHGVRLAAGVWMRQPDSEYQFIFEQCSCFETSRKEKSGVLEDKINIPQVGTSVPQTPVKPTATLDSEAVLSASKILDKCITTISGLAESLGANPTTPQGKSVVSARGSTAFPSPKAAAQSSVASSDGQSAGVDASEEQNQRRITEFLDRSVRLDTSSVCENTFVSNESMCCEDSSMKSPLRPGVHVTTVPSSSPVPSSNLLRPPNLCQNSPATVHNDCRANTPSETDTKLKRGVDVFVQVAKKSEDKECQFTLPNSEARVPLIESSADKSSRNSSSVGATPPCKSLPDEPTVFTHLCASPPAPSSKHGLSSPPKSDSTTVPLNRVDKNVECSIQPLEIGTDSSGKTLCSDGIITQMKPSKDRETDAACDIVNVGPESCKTLYVYSEENKEHSELVEKEIDSSSTSRDGSKQEDTGGRNIGDDVISVVHSEQEERFRNVHSHAGNRKAQFLPVTSTENVLEPEENDAEVSPSLTGAEVLPSVIDREVLPSVTDREVLTSLTDREVSPSLTDREVSPSLTDREVSPSLTDREMSPSLTDREVLPSLTDREVLPSLTDREVLPSVTNAYVRNVQLNALPKNNLNVYSAESHLVTAAEIVESSAAFVVDSSPSSGSGVGPDSQLSEQLGSNAQSDRLASVLPGESCRPEPHSSGQLGGDSNRCGTEHQMYEVIESCSQYDWQTPELFGNSGQSDRQSLEQPSSQSDRQSLEQPSSQSDRQSLEQPSSQSDRQSLEQPSSQSDRQSLEQPSSQSDCQSLEQPSSQSDSQSLEQPGNNSQSDHQALEPPSSQSDHQSLEQPSSQSDHQSLEQPSSQNDHQSLEQPSSQSDHESLQKAGSSNQADHTSVVECNAEHHEEIEDHGSHAPKLMKPDLGENTMEPDSDSNAMLFDDNTAPVWINEPSVSSCTGSNNVLPPTTVCVSEAPGQNDVNGGSVDTVVSKVMSACKELSVQCQRSVDVRDKSASVHVEFSDEDDARDADFSSSKVSVEHVILNLLNSQEDEEEIPNVATSSESGQIQTMSPADDKEVEKHDSNQKINNNSNQGFPENAFVNVRNFSMNATEKNLSAENEDLLVGGSGALKAVDVPSVRGEDFGKTHLPVHDEGLEGNTCTDNCGASGEKMIEIPQQVTDGDVLSGYREALAGGASGKSTSVVNDTVLHRGARISGETAAAENGEVFVETGSVSKGESEDTTSISMFVYSQETKMDESNPTTLVETDDETNLATKKTDANKKEDLIKTTDHAEGERRESLDITEIVDNDNTVVIVGEGNDENTEAVNVPEENDENTEAVSVPKGSDENTEAVSLPEENDENTEVVSMPEGGDEDMEALSVSSDVSKMSCYVTSTPVESAEGAAVKSELALSGLSPVQECGSESESSPPTTNDNTLVIDASQEVTLSRRTSQGFEITLGATDDAFLQRDFQNNTSDVTSDLCSVKDMNGEDDVVNTNTDLSPNSCTLTKHLPADEGGKLPGLDVTACLLGTPNNENDGIMQNEENEFNLDTTVSTNQVQINSECQVADATHDFNIEGQTGLMEMSQDVTLDNEEKAVSTLSEGNKGVDCDGDESNFPSGQAGSLVDILSQRPAGEDILGVESDHRDSGGRNTGEKVENNTSFEKSSRVVSVKECREKVKKNVSRVETRKSGRAVLQRLKTTTHRGKEGRGIVAELSRNSKGASAKKAEFSSNCSGNADEEMRRMREVVATNYNVQFSVDADMRLLREVVTTNYNMVLGPSIGTYSEKEEFLCGENNCERVKECANNPTRDSEETDDADHKEQKRQCVLASVEKDPSQSAGHPLCKKDLEPGLSSDQAKGEVGATEQPSIDSVRHPDSLVGEVVNAEMETLTVDCGERVGRDEMKRLGGLETAAMKEPKKLFTEELNNVDDDEVNSALKSEEKSCLSHHTHAVSDESGKMICDSVGESVEPDDQVAGECSSEEIPIQGDIFALRTENGSDVRWPYGSETGPSQSDSAQKLDTDDTCKLTDDTSKLADTSKLTDDTSKLSDDTCKLTAENCKLADENCKPADAVPESFPEDSEAAKHVDGSSQVQSTPELFSQSCPSSESDTERGVTSSSVDNAESIEMAACVYDDVVVVESETINFNTSRNNTVSDQDDSRIECKQLKESETVELLTSGAEVTSSYQNENPRRDDLTNMTLSCVEESGDPAVRKDDFIKGLGLLHVGDTPVSESSPPIFLTQGFLETSSLSPSYVLPLEENSVEPKQNENIMPIPVEAISVHSHSSENVSRSIQISGDRDESSGDENAHVFNKDESSGDENAQDESSGDLDAHVFNKDESSDDKDAHVFKLPALSTLENVSSDKSSVSPGDGSDQSDSQVSEVSDEQRSVTSGISDFADEDDLNLVFSQAESSTDTVDLHSDILSDFSFPVIFEEDDEEAKSEVLGETHNEQKDHAHSNPLGEKLLTSETTESANLSIVDPNAVSLNNSLTSDEKVEDFVESENCITTGIGSAVKESGVSDGEIVTEFDADARQDRRSDVEENSKSGSLKSNVASHCESLCDLENSSRTAAQDPSNSGHSEDRSNSGQSDPVSDSPGRMNPREMCTADVAGVVWEENSTRETYQMSEKLNEITHVEDQSDHLSVLTAGGETTEQRSEVKRDSQRDECCSGLSDCVENWTKPEAETVDASSDRLDGGQCESVAVQSKGELVECNVGVGEIHPVDSGYGTTECLDKSADTESDGRRVGEDRTGKERNDLQTVQTCEDDGAEMRSNTEASSGGCCSKNDGVADSQRTSFKILSCETSNGENCQSNDEQTFDEQTFGDKDPPVEMCINLTKNEGKMKRKSAENLESQEKRGKFDEGSEHLVLECEGHAVTEESSAHLYHSHVNLQESEIKESGSEVEELEEKLPCSIEERSKRQRSPNSPSSEERVSSVRKRSRPSTSADEEWADDFHAGDDFQVPGQQNVSHELPYTKIKTPRLERVPDIDGTSCSTTSPTHHATECTDNQAPSDMSSSNVWSSPPLSASPLKKNKHPFSLPSLPPSPTPEEKMQLENSPVRVQRGGLSRLENRQTLYSPPQPGHPSGTSAHSSLWSPSPSLTSRRQTMASDGDRFVRRQRLQDAVLQELMRIESDLSNCLDDDDNDQGTETMMTILEDLDTLPINPRLLSAFPQVIDTLEKCDSDRQNGDARKLSQMICSRYKNLILS
ncbi:uncharacterized protein LOC101860531 [Aplysia californica]|uniref:Uncharacterized protein LOC101860531 n=1 Tax=Aplysia californica TaxID=6500 RepID=A0ABM1AAY7_APLCA|nr:uncharacterized protein LOC101860531 [Aplysia californica]